MDSCDRFFRVSVAVAFDVVAFDVAADVGDHCFDFHRLVYSLELLVEYRIVLAVCEAHYSPSSRGSGGR